MKSIVEIILSSLISGLPHIAIGTVGLILIHTRLKRPHPRAYRYGTFGLALLLANGLWGVLSRTYVQAAFAAQTQHPVALANKITIANLAGFVILTGSLIFVLAAVLADRDSAKSSRGAAELVS
jgi:hypothetical protein